ncbi:MAG: amidohydrolase [Planctomycetota bacterium]|nr:MAG: amidohydrolase [Planctomycetota bacterium]HMC66529.1 amidohydrolase family protein [Gemmataceae bacterium]
MRSTRNEEIVNRRDFVRSGMLVGGALTLADGAAAGQPRPANRRSGVIDTHCHAGKGLNYGKDHATCDPWTTYNDPKWVLRQAEQAGIERSVIFPISNITYAKANEEIAGYVRQYPDRLIGFAKHDPKAEAGKIRALLVREVRELGLKGLKLHAVPTPEILETVAELRIPILMHPPRVGDCLEVVRSHPQISFILAHLGSFASRDWKEHLLAIEAAKHLPNLYLDTSAVVFFLYLERAAQELPAEKLLFGSDAPLVDARVELAKIQLLKLPQDKQEKILGGNIRRLLRI